MKPARPNSCATPAPASRQRRPQQGLDCDFIGAQDGSLCLLPFPDDYYTVNDKSTATGKRVDLHTTPRMPAEQPTASDRRPAVQPQRRLQPGPGDHAQGSRASTPRRRSRTPIRCRSTSSAATTSQTSNEPIVVIDATTPQAGSDLGRDRFERDHRQHSRRADPRRHPVQGGASLHRRDAQPQGRQRQDAEGAGRVPLLPRRPADPTRRRSASRASASRSIFRTLRKAKIKRANLYLAWDFTVASDENIAEPAALMRDDAFAPVLGDTHPRRRRRAGQAPRRSPSTTVTDNPNPELARRVQGTFTVPCYLTNACQAPALFDLDANGNPSEHGNYTANFDCIIPHAAVDDAGASPARPVALRPWPARLGQRGREQPAADARPGAQLRLLRNRRDRVRRAATVPNTIGILAGLLEVPGAHRPHPAGPAQRALPRTADGQPAAQGGS